MGTPKPSWIKVRMPGSPRYHKMKERARRLGLASVCEEARCPNIGECWSQGTATFMVMGSICTRGCRFCAVNTRRAGLPLDADEPVNLAKAIGELDLDYVVVTSVDRDDLPDGGAGHFARCIQEIQQHCPKTMVEVLIPDFDGDKALLRTVADAAPQVIAHNIETVARLTPSVRDPRAGYRQSLDVLQILKELTPGGFTKSSIMVGLGESEKEVLTTMKDLRSVGTNFLTIGQYLQPTQKHLIVQDFIHPDVFKRYEELGLMLGFNTVASGPLVRSSYRAAEFFIHGAIQARNEADSRPEDTWAQP